MHRLFLVCAGLFTLFSAAFLASHAATDNAPSGSTPACVDRLFEGLSFTVCTADPAEGLLKLVHSREDGTLIGQPSAIHSDEGQTLVFAMNAGMFHLDRRPVGLFVEDGVESAPLVRGDGPGNFQLLPNGVFWISGDTTGVSETEAFADADFKVDFATQSGPMLVIDGELHPAFRAQSDSLFIRNGVGVSETGVAVFAISNEPVNFHTFARLFRDDLLVDNALYLDGKVSMLHAPDSGRSDFGFSVGPMVAFFRTAAD